MKPTSLLTNILFITAFSLLMGVHANAGVRFIRVLDEHVLHIDGAFEDWNRLSSDAVVCSGPAFSMDKPLAVHLDARIARVCIAIDQRYVYFRYDLEEGARFDTDRSVYEAPHFSNFRYQVFFSLEDSADGFAGFDTEGTGKPTRMIAKGLTFNRLIETKRGMYIPAHGNRPEVRMDPKILFSRYVNDVQGPTSKYNAFWYQGDLGMDGVLGSYSSRKGGTASAFEARLTRSVLGISEKSGQDCLRFTGIAANESLAFGGAGATAVEHVCIQSAKN